MESNKRQSLINRFLKPRNVVDSGVSQLLPDASAETSEPDRAMTEAANEEIRAGWNTTSSVVKSAVKRGPYNVFSPDVRAKIGRFASQHGNSKAARQFSTELKISVSESTVRNIKRDYLKVLQKTKDPEEIDQLMHGVRGKPAKLGELDGQVQSYVRKLRMCGGIVNRTVVISAATGIVRSRDPSLLKENGGHIDFNRKWSESIMRRMGLSKRKATKAARNKPEDFDDIKATFLQRITTTVKENMIPESLIFNFDQTGCKLVPYSDWTMASRGDKQVEVKGLDDKREITVLLTISADGVLLPAQVIYQGKTNRCQADVTFPDDWNITHSGSHWSTVETMMEYADKILIPYCDKKKEQLKLKQSQKSLAIFDVFAAHRVDKFLDKLKDNNILVIFVPAGCTGDLQPLDVAVNDDFKRDLKAQFISWYSEQVEKALKQDEDIEQVSVDLTTSRIKPKHARWLIRVHSHLAMNTAVIISGFERAGICKAISEAGFSPPAEGPQQPDETETVGTTSVDRPGIFDVFSCQ